MREYITDWDDSDFNEYQKQMPNKSYIVKIDNKVWRGNVATAIIDCSSEYEDIDYDLLTPAKMTHMNYKVILEMDSDENGSYMLESLNHQYQDELEAKRLYEIAEPNGKHWDRVKESKKDRYLRLARHNGAAR